jgi:hypothetical protein
MTSPTITSIQPKLLFPPTPFIYGFLPDTSAPAYTKTFDTLFLVPGYRSFDPANRGGDNGCDEGR